MDATVKIAKGIAETGASWLTEVQLTEKIFEYAQLDRRANESPHQAFARVFGANTPEGVLFRKAVAVAKTGDVRPPGSDDEDAARSNMSRSCSDPSVPHTPKPTSGRKTRNLRARTFFIASSGPVRRVAAG